MHITKQKTPIRKGSNYRTFWKRRGEWTAQRTVRAVKIFYTTLQQWPYVTTHLSKPTERTTSRVDVKCNSGLGVAVLCQGRLINGNKYTVLGRMLAVGKAGTVCTV